MDERTLQALRRVPLFSALSEQALSPLMRLTIRCTYAPGETIFLEREPCQYVYFTTERRACVSGRPGGLGAAARLGPGSAFNTFPSCWTERG